MKTVFVIIGFKDQEPRFSDSFMLNVQTVDEKTAAVLEKEKDIPAFYQVNPQLADKVYHYQQLAVSASEQQTINKIMVFQLQAGHFQLIDTWDFAH